MLPVPSDEERLIKAEETLILLIRTYLQRVSSKLSAAEFVELTKAAIALHPEPKLSLPEKNHLLHRVLETFGTDLSQPIPPLGEQIPQPVAKLISRLIRYQTISRTAGVSAALTQLVASKPQLLTSESIRAAFEQGKVAISPDFNTQDAYNDVAAVLLFEQQRQLSSLQATPSEQNITDQVDQAIAHFKSKYQPLTNIAQPRQDAKLSVSSHFLKPRHDATAAHESKWLFKNDPWETSKDETNS